MKRKIFLLGSVLFIVAVIVIVTVFISNRATEYNKLNELVAELESRGYTIEINDIEKNIYLVGKPKMLIINHNQNIFVYTYKSSKKMEQVAADIPNDYNFFVKQPHFYKMENLIVLYVGADEEMIENLNEIMGVQFAGYHENKTETPKLLSKEGVAPYELSESDTYLLQSLGLEQNTNIISFAAPKTAKSLKINVYVLNDNGTWDVMREGQVSLGQDANPEDRLEGTFSMILKDNYAIDFNINTKGRFSYQTDKLDVDKEIISSSRGFLPDFQEIEINKEIPVAIMLYDSGNSMRSYTMEDFFTPSRFEEIDLVQAVTMIFTDEIN